MGGGRREDNARNELSIETKAELFNFIMSLILSTDKCNNDNEASLMRLLQQFKHDITNFSQANYYSQITPD